jgi:hydrogenase maturation protein HypF
MTALDSRPVSDSVRLGFAVHGAVQGVGFRPFIYRLANELSLSGWIKNSAQGVLIEVEGSLSSVEQFHQRLETDKPPRSFIQSCECSRLDAVGHAGFEIRRSEVSDDRNVIVLPDLATCAECQAEIFDPANRRHRYPFTNCTNCGPRFSIVEALPYDRANTSMKLFRMCPACQAEYDNPDDRRFHAQPNACPACGPQLELWPGDANRDSTRLDGHEALLEAARAIRRGQVVAVKGMGGFHLIVDARNEKAVRRLRKRKHREEKPFALMFPSLDSIKVSCEISPLEERLLLSPEAPIVLLRRLGKSQISDLKFEMAASVAPGNPNLGVMVPSNPLHHLLMAELNFPVVATSGNHSDEPVCTDEFEAMNRLRDIADLFLVHNRPIVRHLDDSIVRVMVNREMVVRRARGYAPLPIQLRVGAGVRRLILKIGDRSELPCVGTHNSILGVGAHLKNTVALGIGEQVFLSQHIGDLETEQAHHAFRRAVTDLPALYDAKPDIIAADLHPDYLSTKFASERRPPARHESLDTIQQSGSETGAPLVIQVQHHIAHVFSCIAENDVNLPALGVAWDGAGYGTDGTIWGGEFFVVKADTVERVASLRPFRLPGGDAATKEPRRAALGLLHELAIDDDNLLLHMQQKVAGMFSPVELRVLENALARGINSPFCSSIGRLFDAVASLVGLRQELRFEGQAAMELEFALDGIATEEQYGIPLDDNGETRVLDWAPMIEAIHRDIRQGVPIGVISAKFHNGLAEGIVTVAKMAGESRVALSGGCFQNRYLTERTVKRLCEDGFQPYWHQRVPANDGGIAFGQIVAARRSRLVPRSQTLR